MQDHDEQFSSVSLKLLNKDYTFQCPKHAEDTLKQAAFILTEKLLATKEQKPTYTNEKIAVLMALEAIYENIQLKQNINTVNTKIESKLKDFDLQTINL